MASGFGTSGCRYSLFVLIIILSLLHSTSSRRRISHSQKAFDQSVNLDWNAQESEEIQNEKLKVDDTTTLSPKGKKITAKSNVTAERPKAEEIDETVKLLNAAADIFNLTRTAEEKYGNSSIFWIDANYKALDLNLTVSEYNECKAWRKHWNITDSSDEKTENGTKNEKKKEEDLEKYRIETEVIDSKKRLKALGVNESLLKEFKAIGIVYKEICQEHTREMWFRGTDDAKKLGITEGSPICEPFKEALNPDTMTLAKLAMILNELINLETDGKLPTPMPRTGYKFTTVTSAKMNEEPDNHISMKNEKSEEGMPVPETTTVTQQSTPETTQFSPTSQTSRTSEIGLDRKETTSAAAERTTTEPYIRETNEIWEEETASPRVTVDPHIEPSEKADTKHHHHHHHHHNHHNHHHKEHHESVSTTTEPPIVDVNSLEKYDKHQESNDYIYENSQRVTEHPNKQPEDYDGIVNYDDDIYDYVDMAKRLRIQKGRRPKRSVLFRLRREVANEIIDDDDDAWLEEAGIVQSDGSASSLLGEENMMGSNGTDVDYYPWIEINATDEINPTMLINSFEAAQAIGLKVKKEYFIRHQKMGLYLPGICADYVPKSIDSFNSSSFEGIKIDGPIGVNISALEAAGVNLTALAEKLRNDTEVDDILSRTEGAVKTLGGSFIMPVLEKNQYDPFSAPIVFQGSAVVVRFGIYIESISNFQTSTMDYDMDIYLMMSWRDARLVNPYDKPILVKEEEILEKIWRPDPFFANAKEAEFHEVTFLNFLMRIYPDGLVLYETRVKITPSCNLILCKYPHDKQTCDLVIKSFAYPIETVRFEWFSRRKDAIDKNPDVKLPELYITRYEPTICNKTRKSGEFSCLRAVFRLKRDVGFHIAQTYIPTSLALMFSWVGVWLPEEFMEGRIGVAITVLLTLSTESAGAREHLPSVSYLKAIDLWFGFITGFVFFTLLQTLFVIGFDKRANQLRKWAMKKKLDVTEELRDAMLDKARRYHKTGRYLDNFCRVFYPLSFILFLIMYYFVFTEGQQDSCLSRQ